MADIKYSITFDLGSSMDIASSINAKVMPALSQAVNALGQATRNNWIEAVQRAKLSPYDKDNYAQSISWNFQPGSMSGYVEATYKFAEEIETGRPARDLKRMLSTSLKVRRTEKGTRFLVIPFRHGGAGTNANPMPAGINKMASQLSKSNVTGAGLRPVGEVTRLSPHSGMSPSAKQTPFLSNPKTKQHSQTAKMTYAWGDRLSKAALLQGGASKEDAKRYAGLVRMNTSTPGGAKSSAYMTFRVMSENSKGWIIPAQPGLFLAKKVSDDMKPKADAVFAEAVKRTLPKA